MILNRFNMKIVKKFLSPLFVMIFLFFLLSDLSYANNLGDRDFDGVPDFDELNIYYTNPDSADTDSDGFSDWIELNSGYSPHNKEAVKLEDSDSDNDGLSDRMELNFKTSLVNADTDGDGFSDGVEVLNGYNPLQGGDSILLKRIEINLGKQELSYFLGDVRLDTVPISSGKPSTPTPKGYFTIINKFPKPWSSYGLWMPYWMGLGTGKFGIHELPVWPSGYREGEDHLGTPVSHGCIRVGVGVAEFLYNWSDVGTPVYIY